MGNVGSSNYTATTLVNLAVLVVRPVLIWRGF